MKKLYSTAVLLLCITLGLNQQSIAQSDCNSATTLTNGETHYVDESTLSEHWFHFEPDSSTAMFKISGEGVSDFTIYTGECSNIIEKESTVFESDVYLMKIDNIDIETPLKLKVVHSVDVIAQYEVKAVSIADYYCDSSPEIDECSGKINLVLNPGFEEHYLGEEYYVEENISSNFMSCWSDKISSACGGGAGANTPDFFTTDAISTQTCSHELPSGGWSLNVPDHSFSDGIINVRETGNAYVDLFRGESITAELYESLIPGTPYLLEFWYTRQSCDDDDLVTGGVASNQGGFCVSLVFEDGDSGTSDEAITISNDNLNSDVIPGEWELYSIPFTAPEDPDGSDIFYNSVNIGRVGIGNEGRFFFDDFKMIKDPTPIELEYTINCYADQISALTGVCDEYEGQVVWESTDEIALSFIDDIYSLNPVFSSETEVLETQVYQYTLYTSNDYVVDGELLPDGTYSPSYSTYSSGVPLVHLTLTIEPQIVSTDGLGFNEELTMCNSDFSLTETLEGYEYSFTLLSDEEEIPIDNLGDNNISVDWSPINSSEATIIVNALNTYNGCSESISFVFNNNFNPEEVGIIGGLDVCTSLFTLENVNDSYTYNVSAFDQDSQVLVSELNEENEFEVTWEDDSNEGVIIIEILSESGNCSEVFEYEVSPCCQGVLDADLIFDNTTASALGYSAYDIISDKTIIIDEEFTIDIENLIFNNCDVYLTPNTKIELENNSTIEINTSSVFQACPNEAMWSGIYADDETEVIRSRRSEFKHALRAMSLSNNAKFFIEDNRFIDNYTGIFFKDYSGTPLLSKLHKNQFSHTDLPLRVPYEDNDGGTISNGIYVYNSSNLQLGLPALTVDEEENVFHFLKYGIYAVNSDIFVYNNRFLNEEKQKAINFFGEYGQDNKLVVGLNSTDDNFANEFEGYNLGVGVYAKHAKTIVKGNSFDQMRLGVYSTEILTNSDISNNNFDQTMPNENTCIDVNRVGKYTESLTVDIKKNTLKDPFLGIRATLIHSDLNIEENDINYTSTYTAVVPNTKAINIKSCHHSFVNLNEVEAIADLDDPKKIELLRVTGIRMEKSAKALVIDNFLKNLKYGIQGLGNLLLTQFRCNYIEFSFNGFKFENDPDNGIVTSLSDQKRNVGAFDYDPNDNMWMEFDGEYSYSIFGDLNTTSTMWQRILVPYNAEVLTSNSYTNMQFQTDEIAESVECTFEPTSTNDVVFRESLLGKVIRDEIIYENMEFEMKNFNDGFAFNVLSTFPDLLSLDSDEDAIYQNYFNTLESSNIGISREVARLISLDELDAAMLKNQELIGDELIYSNEKIVNELYLTKFLNDTIPFEPIDSLMLTEISFLTPYLGGESVYSARIMMGIEVDDYSEMEYRVDGSSINNEQTNEDISIIQYPNPVDDKLQFSSSKNGIFNLVIHDISGKKMVNSTFEDVFELKTSKWNQGIYIYTITGMGKIKNGKFIVIH